MGGFTGIGKDVYRWKGRLQQSEDPVQDDDLVTLSYLNSQSIPTGAIIMWSGTIASIPSGWALCNGSNGTPDLRNRMVAGAQEDNGGVAKTLITGALLQSGGNAVHDHNISVDNGAYGFDFQPVYSVAQASNVPPFYALAFIMKL